MHAALGEQTAAARDESRHVVLAAATLAGVVAAVFGTSIVASLRLLAGAAPPATASAWGDRLAGVEWDVLVIAVVAVVVLRWLPRHAPAVTARMGLARRLPRRVPGGLLGAAAGYVAVAAISSRLGDEVVDHFGLSRAGYPDPGTGLASLLTTSAGAVAAGITEEIVLLALAAAVVQQACARRARWAVPATLTVLIVLRWLVHSYYGWGSLFVLAWVPGAYAIYRYAGSVWPLAIGHVAFDWLAATAQAYPALGYAVAVARWSVTGVGVAVLLVAAMRSVRTAAARPRKSDHGKQTATGPVVEAGTERRRS